MAAPRIVIPMVPPIECSPNSRTHWRKKARTVREAREIAGWATRAGLNGESPGLTRYCGHNPGVVVDIEIAWTGRRKTMDDDNAKASCKAFIDGVSDVLWGGKDDCVRIGELTQYRGEGTTTLILREG